MPYRHQTHLGTHLRGWADPQEAFLAGCVFVGARARRVKPGQPPPPGFRRASARNSAMWDKRHKPSELSQMPRPQKEGRLRYLTAAPAAHDNLALVFDSSLSCSLRPMATRILTAKAGTEPRIAGTGIRDTLAYHTTTTTTLGCCQLWRCWRHWRLHCGWLTFC